MLFVIICLDFVFGRDSILESSAATIGMYQDNMTVFRILQLRSGLELSFIWYFNQVALG